MSSARIHLLLATQDHFPHSILTFLRSLPAGVLVLLILLAILPAVLVVRGFLIERRSDIRQKHLEEDLDILQRTLLPDVPEHLGQLTISTAYSPANGPGAGGDFFDVFTLPDNKIVALIGDLSGHGREALAGTAAIHYELRARMKDGLEPRQALRRTSKTIGDELGGLFVTALICVYDPKTSLFTWASAGHPKPLFVGKDHTAITAASAPPMGLGMISGQRQTTISLPEDTLICLHTDGLNESILTEGRLGEDRLGQLLTLKARDTVTAQDLLDLVGEVTETTPDDMAAVLLHVNQAPQTAETYCEEILVSCDDDLTLVEKFIQKTGLTEEKKAACLEELQAALCPDPVLVKIYPTLQEYNIAVEHVLPYHE